jgi:LDH2 family malate/lactate/ureidoglycolate dehydrogenase
MDDMVADIKSSKLAKGFKEILIPGEGARAREEQARTSGVLLQVQGWGWEKLMETAKELEVDTSMYKVEDGGARVSLKR